MRRLPFDEALTIADSALRNLTFEPEGLIALARAVRGPGAAACRRVAAAADARCQAPWSRCCGRSGCRCLGWSSCRSNRCWWARSCAIPTCATRVGASSSGADSYTWHSSRGALRRDCRRYNLFTLAGWTVLRFSWEDVMLDPAHVRECLALAVRQAQVGGQRRHVC